MPTYHLTSTVDATADELFDWHARPDALHRLMPPWEDTRLVERSGGLEEGARSVLDTAILGPVRARWVAEHTWCERPTGFDDVQRQGPFASWHHKHRFHDGQLEDEVDWQPPVGRLGLAVAGGALRRRIDRMFQFRHRRTRQDLAHRSAPKTVAITGASGLVGSALTHFLTTTGHTVRPLVRDRARAEEQGAIYWNVRDQVIDAEALEGVDAVVHLAGAAFAAEPWSEQRKQVIRSSRVDGTRLLSEALAGLKHPPSVLVSGSAVGIYGDRGDEALTEAAPPGEGFLAEVCTAWEGATEAAQAAGLRVVHLRTGIVLSCGGGALASQLPIFRTGGGGPVGGGRQQVPWIHLDDLVYAIHHLLTHDDIHGPVNGTAPQPVAQREMARAIGRAIGRPAVIPAPAAAVRLAMGRQLADELILGGQRALPQALQDSGYSFSFTDLDDALGFELGVT